MRPHVSKLPMRCSLAGALALCLLANMAAAQNTQNPPTSTAVSSHRVSPTDLLSAVMPRLKAGDTLVFAPGIYRDCAAWRLNNLTLRAESPGTAIFDGVSCQGKAIFITIGENITVDGLVFRNAAVPDKNGAGIRAEGRGLMVRRSQFIRNENGILSSTNLGGTIAIEDSLFDGNGKCAPVCAHGIYINKVDLLTIRGSRFLNTRDGHHIKSRARRTIVTANVIDDGPTGTASFQVELPNGGDLIMQQNKLTKGPMSGNRSSFIAYGMEGLSNPATTINISSNSFINAMGKPTYLLMKKGALTPQLLNNSQQGSILGPLLQVP